jgi:hypothetical protein
MPWRIGLRSLATVLARRLLSVIRNGQGFREEYLSPDSEDYTERAAGAAVDRRASAQQ